MSFHAGQTFTFGEQPSATKWQYLWDNDYALADGTGISDDAILARHIAAGVVGSSELATGVPVQIVSTDSSSVATGTTQLPFDTTIPQITEGNEYLTQAITPKSATNILIVEVKIFVSHSVASHFVTAALFQDATSNALAADAFYMKIATEGQAMKIKYKMVAGTTSSTTFRVRAGGDTAGTTTVNGTAGVSRLGTTVKSNITITEIKV